ncbi:salicylate carboxymethyltransferase-like protein [Cinnamomum micranthum f. kanehirae]|uniref:Salicylate carboxymethyltransferase-like protein n=1 Tax=Cinnamomum micranthum f. kanehirae TaxID=337451 RepID=A0A443P6I6_9MAGN|nr:salicylate carboxymethyltransferase-like protein [Cinnamomum micranthum f. kanehirae]
MDVKTVLSMVGGTGDTSYVNNSETQKLAISNSKHVVEDSIQDLYCTSYPESLNIADLGCSSGPNTLLVIRGIIDAIHERCCQLCRPMPEFRVFLNDLPGNDFNTIFRSLAGFYDTLKEEKGLPLGTCFISGVPGSFYRRLFPRNCLDFVHSSYSLHWLSQIPQGLEDEMGESLNKANIYMAESSPPPVFKAYLEQFQKDFSLFLKLRSEEMTSKGRMVLTLIGRRTEEPSSGESRFGWDLLAQELNKMVSKGVIQKAKLDSFDLPYYSPSAKELKDVIAAEGSFSLEQLQITKITVNTNDKKAKGQLVSKCIRAVTESMLVNHFGEEIIDDLFEKFAKNVEDHPSKEKLNQVNFTFSMTKKV